MTSTADYQASVVESINHSLSEICNIPDESYSWENPRRFSGYAKRLQLVLNQILRCSPENFSASVQTALKGIAGELTKSAETLSVYRTKSKIYVLINCRDLCSSLQERASAMGGWLALMNSTFVDNPDLYKKTADLSAEMKQVQFRVTVNEERIHSMLHKEAEGRQSNKAVHSAIIMDLARALGTDSENQIELEEQIKLLKKDVSQSKSVTERRILLSLEKIYDNWSIKPNIASQGLDLDFEDDEQIHPFKNFICPLTKEVMKEPVVLESSQTYEQTAIQYWIERCIEDYRDPTCPVSGQVLRSLEQKPNIGLAGAIEEWVSRNIDIQINFAIRCLSEDSPQVEGVERALDNIYKISEVHPSSRYRIRNGGIVELIVKLLKNSSRSIGSSLRGKALLALCSMAKDEESKLRMLEDGVTKLAVHSLIGSSEKERENAVKLLLELSSNEEYGVKIASEKGALVLLSSMVGNLEHPALSHLAEQVLMRVEKVEENIQLLAAAGRFEPLLDRLHRGPDGVRIKMALLVGNMTLTNSSKELIARRATKTLIGMLTKPETRIAGLLALLNLSALDDNAAILVNSGVLIALTDILFKNEEGQQDTTELAASTIANIVSKPGHWELASVNKKGISMQSESMICSLLALLSLASTKGQVAVLRILCGVASSPQASESVATHINSGGGVTTIIKYLKSSDVDHRIYAFRLTRILSESLGQVIANELKSSDVFTLLKDKLLSDQCTDGERCEAANVIANLPLVEDEVKKDLGISIMEWAVTALKEQHRRFTGRTSRPNSNMAEGLLGLLLHFVRCYDPTIMDTVRDHQLMILFRDYLDFPLQPRVKQRAALGLKYLSESRNALVVSAGLQQKPSHSFFSSFLFSCGKIPKLPPCPIHTIPCEENSQFCLLMGNSIKPLGDLLRDEDTNVQTAAAEALSTLLNDTSCNLRQVVNEFEQIGVVNEVISLFTEVRPGVLQERLLWMIERIMRMESVSQRQSLDQTLLRALVEAFRHGNANTKMLAQNALTNLKQLSGVSGGQNSSQVKSRR